MDAKTRDLALLAALSLFTTKTTCRLTATSRRARPRWDRINAVLAAAGYNVGAWLQ